MPPFLLTAGTQGLHCAMLELWLLTLLWATVWGRGQYDSHQSLRLNPDPRFKLNLIQSVTVQEGLCVLVSCTYIYPAYLDYFSSGSVFGYWFRQEANTGSDSPVATNNPDRPAQEETRGRFMLQGDLKAGSCSLDIRDARESDSGEYFFRVERENSVKYNYLKYLLSVHVSALTKTPEVHIPETLVSGRPSNFTCSVPWACERSTPPIFSWTTASLGPRTNHFSVLTFVPRPQDHGTNLTCQVTFPGAAVTVETTVQLNVTYAPQKLTIKSFRGNGTEPQVLPGGYTLHLQEGEPLRLVCTADSNPPAEVHWKNLALSLGPEELQLSQVELGDQGEYVCRAQNRLGILEASVHLSVRSPLQLLGPSCSWKAEGLSCSCSSRAHPAPSLRWQLGEGLLEGNSSNASFTVTSTSTGLWTNSSLSLHRDLSAGLKFSCEAQNIHGAQRATVLLLPGKPGSRIEGVQGAIGGAGLMALLAVVLGLVFFTVKIYRRRSAEKAVSKEGPLPAKNAISMSQGHLNASQTDTEKDHRPASTTMPTDAEPEPHYASLSFQGLRPWQPQDAEELHSEYTEIKIHK